MAAYRPVNDGYRRLTAKNRDQLRNPMYARQSRTGCLYFFYHRRRCVSSLWLPGSSRDPVVSQSGGMHAGVLSVIALRSSQLNADRRHQSAASATAHASRPPVSGQNDPRRNNGPTPENSLAYSGPDLRKELARALTVRDPSLSMTQLCAQRKTALCSPEHGDTFP